MELNVIIGFDFGTKNTGTAVGQMITRTATPLKTLHAIEGKPDWLQIQKIIRQWHPDALVVGIPLNMDSTEQPITQLAREFMQELKIQTGLPVHGVDERLTTREAKNRIFTEGGYKALKKADIDSLAAQLMLEQWMATQPIISD